MQTILEYIQEVKKNTMIESGVLDNINENYDDRLELAKLPKRNKLETSEITTLEDFVAEIKKFENKEISEEQFAFDLGTRTSNIVPKENKHVGKEGETGGPSSTGNSGTYWYERTTYLDLGDYTLEYYCEYSKRWSNQGSKRGKTRTEIYTLYKGKLNDKNKKEIYSLESGSKYFKKYAYYWNIIDLFCKD